MYRILILSVIVLLSLSVIPNSFAFLVKDVDQGYQIDYPPDWKIKKTYASSKNFEHFSSAQFDDGYKFGVMQVFVENLFPTTENYFEKLTTVVNNDCDWFGESRNFCSNSTILEFSEDILGGKKAYSILYSFNDINPKNIIYEKITFVPTDTNTWIIASRTNDSQLLEKINNSLSSFHIIEQKFLYKSLPVNIYILGNDTINQSQIIKDLPISSKLINSVSEKYLGIEYLFDYTFVPISDSQNSDFLQFLADSGNKTNLENLEKNIYNKWIKRNGLKNYTTSDFMNINAISVENYLFENFIDVVNRQNNSSNIFFLMNDSSSIPPHTYTVGQNSKNSSTGLMGYGGHHNLYFFDLYSTPQMNYEKNSDILSVSDYTKTMHNCLTCSNKLITHYTFESVSHIIAPSVVFTPEFYPVYNFEILVYADNQITAESLKIKNLDNLINLQLIQHNLQKLVPQSEFDFTISVESSDSILLDENFKKSLSFNLNSNSSDKINFESDKISEHLMNYVNTKSNIVDNIRTIPILLIATDDTFQFSIDGNLLGLAMGTSQESCCVMILLDDIENDTGVDNTDLLLHEIGHLLGLSHPFESKKGISEKYSVNDFFNWYSSPMNFSSSNECGVELNNSCGGSPKDFTPFEKRIIFDAQISTLFKKINSQLEFISVNNPMTDIDSIYVKLSNLVNTFESNSNDNSILYELYDLYVSIGQK